MRQSDKARRLRELLGSDSGIAIAPGCYDALSAMIVEEAGFPVAYMSGLAVAASLGYPDTGVIAAAEMTERAGIIARSVDIPVLADADTGYGGLSNIAETVRAFERAGVAGIHLEDQTNPKKCAALPGKSLVSSDEMCARIQVALEARENPDFVIIGRTDAYPSSGLEAALERAKAYEDAGADATMVMLVNEPTHLRALTRTLRKPTLVLMSEKLFPLIDTASLREMGFPLVIYALSLLKGTVHAQQRIARELIASGTTGNLMDEIAPLEDINHLLKLQVSVERDQRFQQAMRHQE